MRSSSVMAFNDLSTLKKILDYNPKTGCFTWLRTSGSRAVKGRRAGYIRGDGYEKIMIDGNDYYAHRLAWFYMTGEWPKHHIDHINHNPSDNRIENLRVATNHQNRKNMNVYKKNKFGLSGIRWDYKAERWRVQIGVEGNGLYLGSFASLFEAACARKSAEVRFGYHENHGAISA